jgi:hypothetical protein
MKNITFIFAALALLINSGCSNTRPEPPAKGTGLTYRELMLKDYDEMAAIVKKHVKQAHKIVLSSDSNSDWQREAQAELTKAERIILSRPNSDNMVAKLTLEVRREMTDVGNYDDILETMTHEGLQALDPNMNLPVSMKTTYSFLLENLMSELKPDLANDDRQRAMLEQIRDADLEIPYDVMRERKLQGMFLTESPSLAAKRILEDAGFKKGKKKK